MQSIYEQVIAFVAEQCRVRMDRLKPGTTLCGDLGIAGDDGVELLEEFGRVFAVDMTNCDASRYFGSEGCSPFAPFYWLLLAFREGSPEERARLQPVTIGDLVRSAELGRWVGK